MPRMKKQAKVIRKSPARSPNKQQHESERVTRSSSARSKRKFAAEIQELPTAKRKPRSSVKLERDDKPLDISESIVGSDEGEDWDSSNFCEVFCEEVDEWLGNSSDNFSVDLSASNDFQEGPSDSWKAFPAGIHSSPHEDASFQESPGPQGEALAAETPADLFKLFFPPHIVEVIVHYTNHYAKESGIAGKPRGKSPQFHDVTMEEFWAFLGFNIAMGLNHKNQLKDYWSTQPIMNSPWFREVFSRNRFCDIQSILCLSDTSADVPRGNHLHDPLFPIRVLYDWLKIAFRTLYIPDRNLTLDEQLVPMKCQVPFIQCISDKEGKWGLRMWSLTEATTGYLLDFDVYTGQIDPAKRPYGVPYMVATQLLEHYFHRRYHVYMNASYTTPRLVRDLIPNQTFVCGLCSPGKKGFPEVLATAVGKGKARFLCTEHGVTAVRWRDRAEMTAISSIHGNACEVLQRKGGETVLRPALLSDYDRYSRGNAYLTQKLGSYTITTRSSSWWKKLFWRLVDITIVNAYIVYRKNKPKVSQQQFRMDLVTELTRVHMETAKAKNASNAKKKVAVPKHSCDSRKQGLCIVCPKKSGCHTKNYCIQCKKHVCKKMFTKYHEKLAQ